jgi:Domain of unknown function (DUF4878)
MFRTRTLSTGLAVLCCGAALGACGGGDKGDAEQTVKDFVKAINEQDSDKFCGELVSDSFLEGSFGGKGDDAQKQCRAQLKSLKSVNLKLDSVKKTKIDGDKAKVTVELETGGRKQTQVVPLEKQDGDWRLSNLVGG